MKYESKLLDTSESDLKAVLPLFNPHLFCSATLQKSEIYYQFRFTLVCS